MLLPGLCVLSTHTGRKASHHQNAGSNLKGNTALDVHKTLWRPFPLTEKSQEPFNFLCKPLGFVFWGLYSCLLGKMIKSQPANLHSSTHESQHTQYKAKAYF